MMWGMSSHWGITSGALGLLQSRQLVPPDFSQPLQLPHGSDSSSRILSSHSLRWLSHATQPFCGIQPPGGTLPSTAAVGAAGEAHADNRGPLATHAHVLLGGNDATRCAELDLQGG